MTAREHDLEVIATILDGAGSVLVRADDPATVARAVVDGLGARVVGVDELPQAIAEARLHPSAPGDLVRLRTLVERVTTAEQLVARTIDHEEARAADLEDDDDQVAAAEVPASPPSTGTDAGADRTKDAHADRQTVRFALVILVLAQIGGLAVYAVDGDLLALLAPAAALVVLGAVVLRHRRPPPGTSGSPDPPVTSATPIVPSSPVHVPPTAAVRAAEAHLRRQRAAWKVAWWERECEPPHPSSWSPADAQRTTFISVDGDGALAPATFASLTTGLPDAVRVVVVAPPARAGG